MADPAQRYGGAEQDRQGWGTGGDSRDRGRPPEPWPGFHAGLPAPPLRWERPLEGEPPRRSRGPRAIVAALLAALVLLGGAVGVWLTFAPTTTPLSPHPNRVRGSVGSATVASVARGVAPAIVDVNTFTKVFGTGSPSDGQLTPLGAGTGMILTSSGEVLTNNHVVRGAFSIEVSIPGHPGTVPAHVLGVDPTADVALLQLDGVSGLPTIRLGDPSTLQVGERVVAIGNALGRGGAPAAVTGTVSGLDRAITAKDPMTTSEHLSGLIQTNASIKPGDSGGALVDTSGKVVGMITAGAAPSAGRTVHIGFAIPTEAAMAIVNQIRAGNGSSTILLGPRGYLGVEVRAFRAADASRLGIAAASGALVVGVQPGGPADAAGIAPPAVIVSADGQPVVSADALGPILHARTPGQRIQITWVDAGGSHSGTVQLIAGPAV